MTPDKDAIYATPRERIEAFRFDDSVASVFPDMIARSVPGYGLTLEMIAVAARRYALPDSNCYDLGCSLGASTLQIRHNAPPGCRRKRSKWRTCWRMTRGIQSLSRG